MTNQELLELINRTIKYKVNVETLRILLKLVEKNGEIPYHKIISLETLLAKSEINDPILLNILSKLYDKKSFNWPLILNLNNHLVIKKYLNNTNYNREYLKIILEHVSLLPISDLIDKEYIEYLKYLAICKVSIEEFRFFHKVFNEAQDTSLVWSTYYFNYFMSSSIPIEKRKLAFDLLKINVFSMLKNNVLISNLEGLVKKIIKAYELYGYEFANLFATINVCFADIKLPEINNDDELSLYTSLYENICLLDGKIGINVFRSLYYNIATYKKAPIDKRLEFIRNLGEKELILKDKIVCILWEKYSFYGLDYMIALKYALLNNGIRTNPLCYSFLINLKSLDILLLSIKTFKNNRIRKDKNGLIKLKNATNEEEIRKMLESLNNKYPYQDEEKKEEEARKLAIKTLELNEMYNKFMDKKIGLKSLKNSLESTEEENIELVRSRKNERRKI